MTADSYSTAQQIVGAATCPLMADIPGPFNCSLLVLGLLVRCLLKIQETLFHLMTKFDVLQIVPAYDTLLHFPQF